MQFESTTFDLKELTDKIADEGVDSLVELKHARKLVEAAQAFIEAFEEFEENDLDEQALIEEGDEDIDLDIDED